MDPLICPFLFFLFFNYYYFLVFLLHFFYSLFYFILFNFTILYWFCHTSTCIRQGCTHVLYPESPLPPPSPYHPSESSQCTRPKLPVSCIEPGLEIRFLYDIIHVLMPFSKIIPPSLSPTESKRLFYTCLFCCLVYRVIVTIFLNSIYMC